MLDRSFVFMGSARDHIDVAGEPGERRLHLIFPGDETSVRSALKTAMGTFRSMDLGAQCHGVVEIVLAEVLNNVVEHAYAEHGRGVIEIEVDLLGDALAFRITDDGRPMPEGEMPEGRRHDLDVPPDELPEGGFGWFLIRELTERLQYYRSGNRNTLTFRIPLAAAARLN
jgi:serine/threonine-protein kinase RsbW